MESPAPAPSTVTDPDSNSVQKTGEIVAPGETTLAQSAQTNGEPKQQKQRHREKPAVGPNNATDAEGEKKLSGAELKKRKKAEKEARRAAEKNAATVGQGAQQGQQPQLNRRQSGGKEHMSSPKTVDLGKHHKRTGSEAHGKQLPLRLGGAQAAAKEAEAKQKRQFDEKKVSIFGHLYGQPRRTSMAGAGKEVHPAVLALGLQMRDYVICGSNARCVAMLLCFKRVRYP